MNYLILFILLTNFSFTHTVLDVTITLPSAPKLYRQIEQGEYDCYIMPIKHLAKYAATKRTINLEEFVAYLNQQCQKYYKDKEYKHLKNVLTLLKKNNPDLYELQYYIWFIEKQQQNLVQKDQMCTQTTQQQTPQKSSPDSVQKILNFRRCI